MGDDEPPPEPEQDVEVLGVERLTGAVHDVRRRRGAVERGLDRQQRQAVDGVEHGLRLRMQPVRRCQHPQRDLARPAERRDQLQRVDLRPVAEPVQGAAVDGHRQLVQPAPADQQRVVRRGVGLRVGLAGGGAMRPARVELGRPARRGLERLGGASVGEHIIGEYVAEPGRGAALAELREPGRGRFAGG